ncbi:MAG TPA: hypothetical protein VM680_11765 [Verrucomicrobiae bacterium]|nr:hypothetical protein [Verrucomicrobiae bacterium]
MTRHTFDKYEFKVPDGWQVAGRFPLLTLNKPDGVGALRFFLFEPDAQAALDHWSDFSGPVAGKVSTTKDDKAFSKTWVFTRPDGMCLQVNYRCHASQADIELAEVDQILSTLREI